MKSISKSLAEELAGRDRLTIAEVAVQERRHVVSIGKWIIRGLPGRDGRYVRLEALMRGRVWVTSRAALARFFQQLPHSADRGGPIRRSGPRPAAPDAEQ